MFQKFVALMFFFRVFSVLASKVNALGCVVKVFFLLYTKSAYEDWGNEEIIYEKVCI